MASPHPKVQAAGLSAVTAGLVVSLVVALLAAHHIHLNSEVVTNLTVLVTAAAAWVGGYLKKAENG